MAILYSKLKGSLFVALTLAVNTFTIASALIFFYLEEGQNDKVTDLLDSIWWSFNTITTVGHGDIAPVTSGGKILGIFLMLLGTGMFATYTALLGIIFLGRNSYDLEHGQKNMAKVLLDIQSKVEVIEKKMERKKRND